MASHDPKESLEPIKTEPNFIGLDMIVEPISPPAIDLDDREKPYPCHLCPKQYSARKNLRCHLLSHSGENPRCDQCQKWFSSIDSLRTHYRRHTGEKPFTFSPCQKRLSLRVNVGKKVMTYHCDVCQKLFTDKLAIVRHKKIHSGGNTVCEFCGKRFASMNAYQRHVTAHSGEKQYVCPYCQMRFTESYGLHRHKFVHSMQGQFHCKYCQREFHHKDNFKRHIVGCSVRPRNFSCNFCDKKYLMKWTLSKHVRISHGVVNDAKPTGGAIKKCPDELSVKVEPASEEDPSREETLMACKLLDKFSSIRYFPCSFCPKKCPSQKTLKRHVTICHSGVHPENPIDNKNKVWPDKLSVKVEPDCEI